MNDEELRQALKAYGYRFDRSLDHTSGGRTEFWLNHARGDIMVLVVDGPAGPTYIAHETHPMFWERPE